MYIAASDGLGEAVRAVVVEERQIGDMLINVDSVLNWPSKFIATSGVLLSATGELDPTTVTVFYGSLSGSMIHIDSFAPSYSDRGSALYDVILLKPTTAWADEVAQAASSIDAKEDLANKSDNTALGASTSLYPTQHAVKSYVDTGLSVKQDASNAVTTNTAQTITGDKTFTGTVDLSGADVKMTPNIVQTVEGASQTTTTSTSYVDYNSMSVSITTSPTTSGKVLVSLSVGAVDNGNSGAVTYVAIADGSNAVLTSGLSVRTTTSNSNPMFLKYLIEGLSPNTTYTYKMRVKVSAGKGYYNASVLDNGIVMIAEEL